MLLPYMEQGNLYNTINLPTRVMPPIPAMH